MTVSPWKRADTVTIPIAIPVARPVLLREIFGLAVAQRPGGRQLLGLPRLNRGVDRRNRQAYKIIWTTEKLAA
jgi:hypothetical protein